MHPWRLYLLRIRDAIFDVRILKHGHKNEVKNNNRILTIKVRVAKF